MGVKIISDSTCDLSQELTDKYNINILPLHIILGDKEYEDGKNIGPEDIYKWSDANKTTPHTSAPSVSETMDFFKKLTEDGSDLVAFCICGQMSSANNVMKMAVAELEMEDRIYVVDSDNLSTGMGLLVIEAAIMADKGKGAPEIVEEIEKLKPKVRTSFVVDTLTYLYRGGRCSGLAALAGSTLKLHPQITVEKGKMIPGKKYRGRMSKVIMDYAREAEPELMTARPDRVFITHSGCDKDTLQSVHDYLAKLGVFKEILETRAGGVISSHCGPGTLGILYIR